MFLFVMEKRKKAVQLLFEYLFEDRISLIGSPK